MNYYKFKDLYLNTFYLFLLTLPIAFFISKVFVYKREVFKLIKCKNVHMTQIL